MDRVQRNSNERVKTCEENLHVVCVCSGIGFPHGFAQPRRIQMIGKTVLHEGLQFSVLHIGGSPTAANKNRIGVYQGIAFEYLPGILVRPKNSLKRSLLYLYGALLALVKIRSLRNHNQQVCAYTWVGGGFFGITFKIFLRLINVPSVQEVNEWWPGRFQWLQKTLNLLFSDGTIVISKKIEKRLRDLCDTYSITNKIIRIPVLTDRDEETSRQNIEKVRAEVTPYLLWCGNVDGYLRDVIFMLRSLSNVHKNGYKCSMVFAGTKSVNAEMTVKEHMDELGLPRDCVQMTGYVTDEELAGLILHARALLLPLWSDDRSQCRFPTKLGEYLLSKKPVITCQVGDLCDFLTDGQSAYICQPGNESAFAEKICCVLCDATAAESVGKRGKDQAEKWLDFRNHTRPLSQFFTDILLQ